ncbi:hypothetical protein HispidOSU_010659, partial [Sigmodon hispidus]
RRGEKLLSKAVNAALATSNSISEYEEDSDKERNQGTKENRGLGKDPGTPPRLLRRARRPSYWCELTSSSRSPRDSAI